MARCQPVPPVHADDLQLVRPFTGWRPSVTEVLHLRPVRDATRTALCGVRVVPVEVQAAAGGEPVLCLDCAQERRALRASGTRLRPERHAAGA